MKRQLIAGLVAVTALSTLSGCVGVLIGGAATTATAASQERGLTGAVDDVKIRAEISHLWFQHDHNMFIKISMTVQEGEVFLTGTVQKPEHIVEAVRLAWQAAGVRRVVNELKVADGSGGFINYASDVVIANKMRWALLSDSAITNINYTIEVNDAVIYVMGIGQSADEVERVINHAREISGVKRVVNHVRLRNDPARMTN